MESYKHKNRQFFSNELTKEFLRGCSHMKGTTLYEAARYCDWKPLPRSLARDLDLPTVTEFEDEWDSLLITLVLSFTPNLVKLEVCAGAHWTYRWCRPGSLPALKELIVVGIQPGKEQEPGSISGLLAAAPGLERVELAEMTLHTVGLRHENVHEITCGVCCPPVYLMEIMNGFPNLKKFKFGAQFGEKKKYNYRMYDVDVESRLADISMLRSDTLKHLSLDLCAFY